MRLVEVVKGKHTSTRALREVLSLTKKMGKIGVVVGNCDGFVGRRTCVFSDVMIELLGVMEN
jgi:3-hydroxyacyl-CoA dehydrogenase